MPAIKRPEKKEVLDVIRMRRSIRRYLSIPVEWDKIGNIVEAGRFAPSSGNIQNYRFIVITNDDTREKIADACLEQAWMTQAPVYIVIVADLTLAQQYYGVRGERLYSVQNCAAAAQNMLIAATALGLGSCWVGAFEEEMLTSILKIPDYARPQAIITVGYPDEDPHIPPTYTIEHLTYIEGWGSKIRDGANVLGYYYLGTKAKKFLDKGVNMLGKAVQKGHEKISQKLNERKENNNEVNSNTIELQDSYNSKHGEFETEKNSNNGSAIDPSQLHDDTPSSPFDEKPVFDEGKTPDGKKKNPPYPEIPDF